MNEVGKGRGYERNRFRYIALGEHSIMESRIGYTGLYLLPMMRRWTFTLIRATCREKNLYKK